MRVLNHIRWKARVKKKKGSRDTVLGLSIGKRKEGAKPKYALSTEGKR